jgi:chorismate mutase/prephenate dehydratase
MASDPELDRLRAAMDVVNRRLVDVLHDRARLCRAIGAWKRAQGLAAADPGREHEMLQALLRDAPGDGFAPAQLAAILQQVFTASRALVTGGDRA